MRIRIAAVAACAVLLAGCGTAVGAPSAGPAPARASTPAPARASTPAPARASTPAPARASTPAPAPAATPARAPAAAPAGSLRLLVEPQDGLAPIYRLIGSARRSIDVTMYELADPTAEADLAAAAARGVDVRVLLDSDYERSRNAPAAAYLEARGVKVAWAPPSVIFHQKTVTVDATTSAVMTLNLVSEDYPGTRDLAVIDTRPADVAAIVTTFDADFAGRAIDPPGGADLVWSPTTSQSAVLGIIAGAHHTLSLESEEMDDADVVDALAAAARRGVDVEVTMTADAEWDDDFDRLAAAGVHVHLYADRDGVLYIHAKAILADAGLPGQRALVGSQNISVASLRYDRELGVETSDRSICAPLAKVLASDYAGAAGYRASS